MLDVRPIGDDPAALMRLHPGLNIWDAYAIVHLLMPDGSMQTGGAAVAEVLRRLPAMRGLAQIIDLHIGGFRPGVFAVNIAYTVLAEIRPLLGCASCGSSNPVIQSVGRLLAWFRRGRQADRRTAIPHFATATIYTPQKAL
jgi:hypothetical protein